MSRRLLIEGGRVIDPANNLNEPADLLIEDGVIRAVERPGTLNAQLERGSYDRIKADGLWVTPGLIDVHVHFRDPGQTGKESIQSGSAAAVAGGFTAVACMANTQPVNDNALVTRYIQEQAKAALCRVFPIGAVSKGLKGERLADIGEMIEAGAVALSDDGMPVMNSLLMRRAMEYANAFEIPVISHAEDCHLVAGAVLNEGKTSTQLGVAGNPKEAEEIMIAREIALCRLTGCHVHIAHISTKQGLILVERAKEEGLQVTTEVCPHHLFLTDELLKDFDSAYKMAPPLRSTEDIEYLRAGLRKGTIDMIATDHAPHGIGDKDCELADACFGVIGLESSVGVTFDLVRAGILSEMEWINRMTVAPARFLRLDLGTLTPGKPADVTILDHDAQWTFGTEHLRSKSGNCPFIGRDMKIKTVYTIVNGEVRYGP